jgi:predicted DNA-binding antitoxin AbrB/MazE fold protein
MTVRATFKNGVFTPSVPLDLPEGAKGSVDLPIIDGRIAPSPAMTKAYEILLRRYDGVDPDLAQRHDEHQP